MYIVLSNIETPTDMVCDERLIIDMNFKELEKFANQYEVENKTSLKSRLLSKRSLLIFALLIVTVSYLFMFYIVKLQDGSIMIVLTFNMSLVCI